MKKLLILRRYTLGHKFNATTTSTANENEDFSTGITEVELDEVLTNDRNIANNIIIKVKENNT